MTSIKGFFVDFSVSLLRSVDSDFFGCIKVSYLWLIYYFGSHIGLGESFGARETGILDDNDFYC